MVSLESFECTMMDTCAFIATDVDNLRVHQVSPPHIPTIINMMYLFS